MKIGNWIRRNRAAAKWHIVESVVSGDAITRCGRRMRNEAPFTLSIVEPLTRLIGQPQNCRQCSRGQ